MNIRRADLTDTDAIERLNREVQEIHIRNYPHIFKRTSPEEVKSWIRNLFEAEDVNIFVVSEETRIVGYVTLRMITQPENPFKYAEKIAYIDQICVTQSRRGRGIGRRLMEHAIEHAADLGFERIELDVWHKNTYAREAFEKIGFKTSCEKRVLDRGSGQGRTSGHTS